MLAFLWTYHLPTLASSSTLQKMVSHVHARQQLQQQLKRKLVEEHHLQFHLGLKDLGDVRIVVDEDSLTLATSFYYLKLV